MRPEPSYNVDEQVKFLVKLVICKHAYQLWAINLAPYRCDKKICGFGGCFGLIQKFQNKNSRADVVLVVLVK